MKFVFYSMFGVISVVGAWFVLTSLTGRYRLGSLHPTSAKLVLLLGACLGVWQLYSAYVAGELEGRWLVACGHAAAALGLCQGVQLAAVVIAGLLRR